MSQLTNEQRAHDLAIATLPLTLKDPNLLESLQTEKGDVQFDVYTIYKGLYAASLESFNNDFPNNQ